MYMLYFIILKSYLLIINRAYKRLQIGYIRFKSQCESDYLKIIYLVLKFLYYLKYQLKNRLLIISIIIFNSDIIDLSIENLNDKEIFEQRKSLLKYN